MGGDLARKNRKRTRRGCRRNNNQKGGGYGAGWSVGAPIVRGIDAGAENVVIGNCHAVTPGYAVTPPSTFSGLPGMRGGAYTFNLGSQPVPNSAGGLQGNYPEVNRLGCEGTTINPMNPGPHTGSSAPPGGVNPWTLLMKGGSYPGQILTDMRGGDISGHFFGRPPIGSYPIWSGMSGGVHNSGQVFNTKGGAYTDNPSWTAPTAGYANGVMNARDSVGGSIQMQIPYDARIANPACLTTRGGARRSKRVRSGNRKARRAKAKKGGKSRKANRR
jgi:hypothetical protein